MTETWRSAEWQQAAQKLVSSAIRYMMDGERDGSTRKYLESMGFTPETQQVFRLGAAIAPDPVIGLKSMTVVVPWINDQTIMGIAFHFSSGHVWQKPGSEQTLFGLQNVGTLNNDLVLCRGEFNAMAIWQAVGKSVNVVGFADAGWDQAVELAAQTASNGRRVFVWTEREDTSILSSPFGEDRRISASKILSAWDAKTLLSDGRLSDFLGVILNGKKPWQLEGPGYRYR